MSLTIGTNYSSLTPAKMPKISKNVPEKKGITNNNSDNVIIKNNPKQNRENAIKSGTLVYNKGIKIFGIEVTKSSYTYTLKNSERVDQIKKKFGIKDNAIQKNQPWIKDDYAWLNAGTQITFNVEDLD